MNENKFKQIEYPGWDDKAKPAFTILNNKIDIVKITDNLDKLGREITILQAEKVALQKLGIVDARPHYRDDKYLYLVHPQVKGKRKREYIGKNKVHINNAMKAIERYKVWVKVVGKIKDIKYRCECLDTQYETFVDNLDPANEFSRWYGF